MTAALWVAIVIAAIGSVGALYTARSTNRKLNSEGINLVTDSTVVLLAPLHARIDDLEVRVRKLEQEVEHWEIVAAKGKAAYEDETGRHAGWYIPFTQ